LLCTSSMGGLLSFYNCKKTANYKSETFKYRYGIVLFDTTAESITS